VACGYSCPDALVLDHVGDDGADHRRLVGNNSKLYQSLELQGYPPVVQVLCANCNMIKERYRRGILLETSLMTLIAKMTTVERTTG
jgi:hypothetical protein